MVTAPGIEELCCSFDLWWYSEHGMSAGRSLMNHRSSVMRYSGARSIDGDSREMEQQARIGREQPRGVVPEATCSASVSENSSSIAPTRVLSHPPLASLVSAPPRPPTPPPFNSDCELPASYVSRVVTADHSVPDHLGMERGHHPANHTLPHEARCPNTHGDFPQVGALDERIES